MSGEWFPDSKDEKAGIEENMGIFKDADKKLIYIFNVAYKKRYKEIKAELARTKEKYENEDNHYKISVLQQQFYDKYKKYLDLAVVYFGIRERLSPNEKTPQKDADQIGNLLGLVLALIDHGITSSIFKDYCDKYGTKLNLLDNFKEIQLGLKEINKNVKHDFIVSRIKKIAKKNAGRLSNNQKEFLARIAYIFEK